ncbi:MAG TPA: hypothetical protein VNS55_13700 [Nocardioides sp.]|nr:hypothetical protein [Nocardioides sp.]
MRFNGEVTGLQSAVRGSSTGAGHRLEVRLGDPALLEAGGAYLRELAATLAARGVTVVIRAGDVIFLEVGASDPPWRQRRPGRTGNVVSMPAHPGSA